MRIEQLQYFAAVPRYGSLRRASEPLHVSVPALSEGITKLERELGLTLLDRQRSGARISAQGREILPAVMDVLDAVDRLRAAVDHQSKEHRLLRVGSAHPTAPGVIADTVHALQAEGDGFSVESYALSDEGTLAGVREGRLDVGLLLRRGGDDTPSDLAATPVADGYPVVVLARSHPLARREVIGAEDLRGESLVEVGPSDALRRVTREIMDGHRPSRVITVDVTENGIALVADHAGVALLPDFSVVDGTFHRSGAIAVRPLAAAAAVRLVAVHRRRPTLPIALQTFLRSARRLTEAHRQPHIASYRHERDGSTSSAVPAPDLPSASPLT